ncbi:MAG: undecaprenyl/decaprenyl-phosphate alpha-N-acetylglucosaminyl 1-phosphate transferase [Phycisphaerae bacterium]|nr:undecaprenyl/decaprenyl-phosphate alpha-N-acetylglucosaminyl 1-phosphate transferase [Phycisphaerae bacterium]
MLAVIEPKYSIVEVLRYSWWISLVAFLAAIVATPVFRWIAYHKKIVDRPDDLLKPHARPVAYLGGLGICVGLLAGLAAYVAFMGDLSQVAVDAWRQLISADIGLLQNPLWNVTGVATGSIVITIVGLLDDLRDIEPKHKILGQLLAAAILLGGGVGTRMVHVLVGPLGLALPVWVTVLSSALVCMVIVIMTCNATNLLDGLDGLCGGVTAIIALGFFALAAYLAMWGRFPGTDELRVALALAMAGAILGFLPYNTPPASIFMGDAGSMLLGFFVATMMALLCQEGPLRWFLAAWFVFGLPLLDTALAVVRRRRAGVGIFQGDRSHLYDQLVDRGLTVKKVVILFYDLAILAAVLGVTFAIALRTRYAVIVYAVLFLSIWVVFWVFGMVTPPPKVDSGEDDDASADGDT